MDIIKSTSDLRKLIVNQSTNVIIKSISDFIKQFNPQSLNNPKIMALIKEKFSSGTPTGDLSGVGKVVIVTDENIPYIIKKSELCDDNTHHLKKSLCDLAIAGDFVFQIPNSVDGKTTILTSTILLELFTSILLSEGEIKKYSPNFLKVYGVQYVPDEMNNYNITPSAYVVMEPLDNYKNLIKTEIDCIMMMFQISWGLARAQDLYRFVHFDLHAQNVMCRKADTNILNIYDLGNGKFFHTRQSFDMVIFDYGMSRFETDDISAVGRNILHYPPGAGGIRGPLLNEYLDYYAFNPYYDICSYVNSFFYFHTKKLFPSGLPKNFEFVSQKLLRILYSIDETVPDAINWVQENITMKKNWRPNPGNLGYVDGYKKTPPLTPHQFLQKLAMIIEEWQDRNDIPVYNLDKKEYKNVSRQLLTVPLVSNRRLTELVGVDGITTIKSWDIPKKKMQTSFIPLAPYNTLGQTPIINKKASIESIMGSDNIMAHFVLIEQNDLITKHSYVWKFDCCRIIKQDIFRAPNIDSGIAINSSFFRIKDDDTPVGYFKTYETLIKNESKDQKFYGAVGIGYDGFLKIGELTDLMSYKDVMTAGPLLILNGVISSGINCNERNSLNQTVFSCRHPIGTDDVTADYFSDGFINCNKISPGTFGHICQPNPRSAIIIENDGKRRVVMLYIEGRDNRGKGADLWQLMKSCKDAAVHYFEGNTNYSAINLDGGLSSQIIWKSPGESVIRQANPAHNFVYPVGATISITKQK